MNDAVTTIDLLPGSVSKFVYLSTIQMLLMYLTLILIIVAIESKKRHLLMYISAFVVLIVGINSYQRIINMNHKELLIPYTNSAAIAISYDNTLDVFTDDTTKQYKRQFEQTLTTYISRYGISNISFYPLDTNLLTSSYFYNYPFIQLDSLRLVVWEKTWLGKIEQVDSPLNADILVFENNPFLKPEQIENILHANTYIFGPTNKKQTVNIWKKIFEQRTYINMHETGSIRLEVK